MTLDHLPRGIGALMLLLALALLAGIALDGESLARWWPEFRGVGRNTLLFFALAGTALFAGAGQARWLGGGVALMAAAVLLQYPLDFFPLDSRWQYVLNTLSDQPWPGRMSPPTAISFLAAGIILAWWPQVRGGARLAALQFLLIVLLLPALISLSGYGMGMAVLITRTPNIALLSLPTAAGLALLFIALQIQVSRGEGARDYFARYPDRYMLTVAAMLLLVLLLVGGLASSVLLGRQDLDALHADGTLQIDTLRGNLWNIVLLDLGLAVLGALLLYRFMLPLARSLREARSNLSATLRHHQLILENVADGIIGLDTRGRAIYLNDAAERLLGYPHEDLRREPVHGIVHQRRRDGTPYPREECPIFQTLQSGQPRRVDQDVFWRKDQQALEVEYACTPILEGGRVAGAVVVFRDMTERHREAAALSRWQHIFEHAEWGMVVCSADSQNLEDVNPAFARMHGYSVEELSGCPIVDVFAPEYRAELPERIRLAHEQGHHLWESWHLRRDGSLFPVQIDVTAVKDEAGQVLYRVVNVQDISAQRAREDQLGDFFQS